MEVKIISRDIEAGTAKIEFSHAGVIHTNDYDLAMVIPGTKQVFAQYGVVFDEARQQQVIDRLAAQIEQEIDAGILQKPQ